MNDFKKWGFSTLGVRAAEPRTGEMEHSAAMHLTSSFVYTSAAEAAAVFAGEKPGNVYSRFTNPTVHAFEQRLAAMEGPMPAWPRPAACRRSSRCAWRC